MITAVILTLGFPAFTVGSESLFGHWVITSSTKGVATQNAPDHQYKACKKATFLKCLNGIG